jgi:hypothetical protein
MTKAPVLNPLEADEKWHALPKDQEFIGCCLIIINDNNLKSDFRTSYIRSWICLCSQLCYLKRV